MWCTHDKERKPPLYGEINKYLVNVYLVRSYISYLYINAPGVSMRDAREEYGWLYTDGRLLDSEDFEGRMKMCFARSYSYSYLGM